MKQIIILLSVIFSLGNAAMAQNPLSFSSAELRRVTAETVDTKPVKVKMAQFQFREIDNTYDFGTIPEGPKVTHDFRFVNTGDAPLTITNAQASCGCTSPVYPKEAILPGQKGVISVTYSSEGHPGDFMKSIYLTSNAESPNGSGQFELFIKGKVKPKAITN